MKNSLFLWILEVLFPRRCFFCGKSLRQEEIICAECENNPQIQPKLYQKWLNKKEKNAVLSVAPYLYEGELRRAIHALKFYGRKDLAFFFGKQMAWTVNHVLPSEAADVITCVPMSSKKKRERGYNQAELLAQSVSRELKIPYYPLLEKFRKNESQHNLNMEERKENVQGVYRIYDAKRTIGKHVLLVDDVVTTGSTCAECAQVLLEAGAVKVVCVSATTVMGRSTVDKWNVF